MAFEVNADWNGGGSRFGRPLFVKQSRSTIRERDRCRKEATIRGLKLRGPGSISVLEDTPSVRGMIDKVDHLVGVYDTYEEAKLAPTLKKSKGAGEASTKRGGAWRAPVFNRSARSHKRPTTVVDVPAAVTTVWGTNASSAVEERLVEPDGLLSGTLLDDLGRLREELDGALQNGVRNDVVGTLVAGAALLDLAFRAGGVAMAQDDRQKASMTAIQARALLRQYIQLLFSPDPAIADGAARLVALRAPMSGLADRTLPLEGDLSPQQSDSVIKAVVQVLSEAGDRCYTRAAPVVVGPSETTGLCRIQGRVQVTKIVQALAARPRISLPDRGDKALAQAAEVTLEISGADNPVPLDRQNEPADDAILIDGVFETEVRQDAVEAGLRLLLVVPGLLVERLPLKIAS
jgi:large subunit ribosomal protein L30